MTYNPTRPSKATRTRTEPNFSPKDPASALTTVELGTAPVLVPFPRGAVTLTVVWTTDGVDVVVVRTADGVDVAVVRGVPLLPQPPLQGTVTLVVV